MRMSELTETILIIGFIILIFAVAYLVIVVSTSFLVDIIKDWRKNK